MKSLYRYEIGRLYLPGVTDSAARKYLRRQIVHNPRLRQELEATGYQLDGGGLVSPRQIEIIYRYLGEP